jgi:hypothetical protein
VFRAVKRTAVFTLKLYGDESADETRSRVFTVAGVLAQQQLNVSFDKHLCNVHPDGQSLHRDQSGPASWKPYCLRRKGGHRRT